VDAADPAGGKDADAAGRGRVFDLASATAIAYSEALEGPGPGVSLRLRRAVFDRLVYAKIRAAFGGRTRWAISGGAALGPRLGHFFRGVGVTVREGYADVYLGRSPGSRYPLTCVDSTTRSHLESVLPEGQRSRGGAAVRSGAWDRQRATMDRNLLRMRSAGIAIATGTDAGNPGTAHGPSIYREMEAMQHAGMPPADVLASTTIVAARAMRRERDLGSLVAGKRADLVVLDGDPQSDIANARLVRMVMRGGALYGRTELLPRR